ncbi:protein transport protein SEC24 [Nadsonia fulvescens var. elongata DSM 6958]|uniref:Protein transport protein SEC24 n=1 Tax=Nadsonia fulvescens var. elongata DSM 6958 TaxID=857566 RepID=A0A1E3PKB4_9ASCO|nr:protein transport protein SEC24 [Nadsonia fulvescens var. elongata DSM 6958]
MASQGAPAHSRRRLYPQQQYDFSAQQPPVVDPAAAAYSASPIYGQSGQPVAGGMFTPATAIPGPVSSAVGSAQIGGPQVGINPAPSYGYNTPGAEAMAGQFGQMNLGASTGAGTPAAAPALPLNSLYNIDLLHQMPPPINDLSLPPPPLILPPTASVTNSPDSNAPYEYMRSTLNAIPATNSLLKKSKLPFALVIRPYASLLDKSKPVQVVGDTVICRCRRCRAYINPFVQFLETGNRWKCNMCNLTNEVPSTFDFNVIKNIASNRYDRAELNHSVVDFIAPPEYMVRPPQPLVYVFVLDISVNAIKNGLLATAVRTIQESLDRIPNKDGRTRIGLIGVDSCLHYFSIPASSEDYVSEPSLLVCPDIEDPFLPVPENLLVTLSNSRENIDNLLSRLPDMFAQNTNQNNALGSALTAAYKLISPVGGKIVCITASLPNVGIGKLEFRDDKKFLGTNKEGTLLQTANSFYKSFAVDCNKQQVSVDMFLFSSSYQDVASLSSLPRFTAGQTHLYPGWSASRSEDAIKFAHELGEHLSQEVALEAVLRVRGSTGLRMNAFYGNFFNRSSDLCSFPTFPRDQSYVVEVSIDETINKSWVPIQSAVLHTTCHGERRIRVTTIAIPTTNLLQDVYASADQVAITAYLTQKAVEKALSSGLGDAREYLQTSLTTMLQTYKKDLMTTNVGASAPLQFSANLRMLPLLVNALIKHVGLRKSAQIPSDLRSAGLCLLSTLPAVHLVKYIHPDFFSLHDMPDEAGNPSEETGEIILPPKLNLTAGNIATHGLYLINDGQILFLWVGRDAVPLLIEDVFGVPSLQHVKAGKAEVPELDNPMNQRVRSIIAKCRESKDQITWPNLYIVREDGDPALRLWASTFLIEDKSDQALSYYQFLGQLRDKVNN